MKSSTKKSNKTKSNSADAVDDSLRTLGGAQSIETIKPAFDTVRSIISSDNLHLLSFGKPLLQLCRKLYEKSDPEVRCACVEAMCDVAQALIDLHTRTDLTEEQQRQTCEMHGLAMKCFYISCLRHMRASGPLNKQYPLKMLRYCTTFCKEIIRPTTAVKSMGELLTETPQSIEMLAAVAADIPLLPFYSAQVDAFTAMNRAIRTIRKAKRDDCIETIDQAIAAVGWGGVADLLMPSQTGAAKVTVHDVLHCAHERLQETEYKWRTLRSFQLSGFVEQEPSSLTVMQEVSTSCVPLHVGVSGISTYGLSSSGNPVSVQLLWTDVAKICVSYPQNRIRVDTAMSTFMFNLSPEVDMDVAKDMLLNVKLDSVVMTEVSAPARGKQKADSTERAVANITNADVARLRSGPEASGKDTTTNEERMEATKQLIVAEAMILSSQMPERLSAEKPRPPKSSTSGDILLVSKPAERDIEELPELHVVVGQTSRATAQTAARANTPIPASPPTASSTAPAHTKRSHPTAQPQTTENKPQRRAAAVAAKEKGYAEEDDVDDKRPSTPNKRSASPQTPVKPAKLPTTTALPKRSSAPAESKQVDEFEFVDSDGETDERTKPAKAAASKRSSSAKPASTKQQPRSKQAESVVAPPRRAITPSGPRVSSKLEFVSTVKKPAPTSIPEAIKAPVYEYDTPKAPVKEPVTIKQVDEKKVAAQVITDDAVEVPKPPVTNLKKTATTTAAPTVPANTSPASTASDPTYSDATPPQPAKRAKYAASKHMHYSTDNIHTNTNTHTNNDYEYNDDDEADADADPPTLLMSMLTRLAQVGEAAGVGQSLHSHAQKMIQTAGVALQTIQTGLQKSIEEQRKARHERYIGQLMTAQASSEGKDHTAASASLAALQTARSQLIRSVESAVAKFEHAWESSVADMTGAEETLKQCAAASLKADETARHAVNDAFTTANKEITGLSKLHAVKGGGATPILPMLSAFRTVSHDAKRAKSASKIRHVVSVAKDTTASSLLGDVHRLSQRLGLL